MSYDLSSLFDADDPRWSGGREERLPICATCGCEHRVDNHDDVWCYECRVTELMSGKKPMAGIAPHEKKESA